MSRATSPTFLAVLVFATGLSSQEPDSRPTSRDDASWEKGLRQAAAKLIASKKVRDREYTAFLEELAREKD